LADALGVTIDALFPQTRGHRRWRLSGRQVAAASYFHLTGSD
jgi:hypothetical protein